MEIVDLEQGSDSWLEWRTQHICASDIGPILGKSPFADALDIYHQKKGISRTYVNEAMRRGTFYEGPIRRAYNEANGTNFQPICVELGPYGASLDGYDATINEIIEIKCVSKKSFDAIANGIPPSYMYQMQWQLYLTDVSKCTMVVYCHEDAARMEIPVMPNQELMEESITGAATFISNHLTENIPPHRTLIQTVPITKESKRLEDLLDQKAVIDEEIKSLKEKLIGDILLKDETYHIGGLTVVYSQGRTSYDYNAMKKDGIEIEKYMKKGSPSQSIRRRKESTND